MAAVSAVVSALFVPPVIAAPSAGSSNHVANNSADNVAIGPSLIAGHKYRVTATGTASDWCPPTAKAASDCSYGSPLDIGKGVDALYCYAEWRCPGDKQLWRPLQVSRDGGSTWLGLDQLDSSGTLAYESSHEYAAVFKATESDADTLMFHPADGSPSDNSGGWDVSVADLGASEKVLNHLNLAEAQGRHFAPHSATLASGATVKLCNEDSVVTGVIFTHSKHTSLPYNDKDRTYQMKSLRPGECHGFTVKNHTGSPVTITLFSEIHAAMKAVLTVEPAE